MNDPSFINDHSNIQPFDDAFRGFLRHWSNAQTGRTPRIRLDLSETDSNYDVTPDVPGVRKEDSSMRVDANQVTTSTESKEEKDEKKDRRVIRSERSDGYAGRSGALDSDVEASNINVRHKDGVLQLTLPKKVTTSATRAQTN